MWIVVNEEFHDDPLTQYVAPPRPYAGSRDIFVFVDAGEQGLKKFAATGYVEENVRRFFEAPGQPTPPEKILAELYATYRPKRIGLGIGGRRGVQRSLTHDSYQFLSDAMGPEAAGGFVSAADLIEEYLATRLPEEFEYYAALVELTDTLAHRALSNDAITPGVTTVGDVRRWLYNALSANGVRPGSSRTCACSARGCRTGWSAGTSRWRRKRW